IVGMVLAVLLTTLTSWIVRRQRPLKVDRWFRRLQLFSAALFSLGHGTNDSQKGMGIITAAMVAGGLLKTTAGGKLPVPFWVIICCHLAMGGGTMAGGWRIIKTMGQRITKLTPFGGFSAETAGGITIVANAIFGIPVSTTHTITGAIVGVGATRRLSAVRWGITRRIVWAWILTIPGAAFFGAVLFKVLLLVLH
ncbi:MAG TPA: inorganic phosphate transporter, partial [Terriglobales bacterium]|nr:inorganic phosphate transporter [Terriglobales bacterium]